MSDAKTKILARRARFVAAALAGLAVQSCHKETDATPDAAPAPPLSTASAPVSSLDAALPGPDASAFDAGSSDAAATASHRPDAGSPRPHPCLSIVRPDGPMPPAPHAGESCSPPYWVDAEGRRHYKLQCLER